MQIPKLTWMPYTSHVLDLFLEDVGRQKWADELFALAKQIAKFIYAQHKSPAIFPAKSQLALKQSGATHCHHAPCLSFVAVLQLAAHLLLQVPA